MTERQIDGAGVKLTLRERGDAAHPTIVLIHGYPDTQAVWDPMAENLADRFHVVTYDVRGHGKSQAPSQKSGYTLALLMADLGAVIEATAPAKKVHLVGHDWGSLQGWEAATTEVADRLASYTAISGPSLDHAAYWMRARLSRPTPRRLAELFRQLKSSWYIVALCTPGGPEKLWRTMADRWPAYLEAQEGILTGDDYPAPTLAQDGKSGAHLYAQNVFQRLRHPRANPVARVPVQVIVAERDRYLSPGLCSEVARWVPDLRLERIDAGHWAIRTHADAVARYVAELAAGETPARARAS